MNTFSLELWRTEETEIYFKWPFYDMGVHLEPSTALNDVVNNFTSLMLDKPASGRLLARLIDQGKKAGLSVKLHVPDVDAALEGLTDQDRLKTAVLTMNNEGLVRYTPLTSAEYSNDKLRRLFGLR